MNLKFFSSQTIANTNSQTLGRTFYMPMKQVIPPQPVLPILEQPSLQPSPETPSPTPKKMKWGEPTWFLLHTLSVKVKESEFKSIRADLLNRIYAICINLPCPDCANHAKMYLDSINFNTIQTKEDLKVMLYNFHNNVNKKKGYPFFPYDQLNEKYSLAITNNIIRNFMIHFSDRNRSLKLLATDLHRLQLCDTLKKWFNERISCFDT
jgi:hypothetical protein